MAEMRERMRNLGLMAMAVGAIYLWVHFRSLPIFEKLHVSKGITWMLSAILAAALLAAAALFKTVVIGFYVYLCMFYVLTDLVWLCVWLFGRERAAMRVWRRIYLGGVLAFAFALLLSVYGYFNAKNPTVTEYELAIEKAGIDQDGLRVVMISDLHLGTNMRGQDLPALAGRMQGLAPDVLLLCGDIYEEKTTREDVAYSLQAFAQIDAPLGIYYVPGNHEYDAQRIGVLDISELIAAMQGAGITTLRDETVLVDGSFYLIGRDDPSGGQRVPLQTLMADVDPAYPVIVMDHRPLELALGAEAGVDLQFSGHTHAGQLFPAGELAEWFGINEMNYGLRSRGAYHIIVSSGLGTWGFPMRVGSPSEIVVVEIAAGL